MHQPTFDQLPRAVQNLGERLAGIEQLLATYLSAPSTNATASDEYMGIKDAALTLNVSQQTVYQNIRKIPHVKRFGKLYFKRSDLIAYLEDGAALNKKGGKQ
ncbi:helix-turn-helix domain-containing protein [Telluribacter sp.]|jgi:hypothetical protein|uniref:helix-turn-helix domain-containing protein n=1 Tax=Telluribacter sp. TaxID=1978767 RepID=UPI002E0F0F23|nr:helix-turn-helix domain-containing protein [Telluribacter sp.]